MTVKEWLGEENQLGIDIWTKKYAAEGEDFDSWITRVSGGNKEIAQYMKEKSFYSEEEFYQTEGLLSLDERLRIPTAM